MKKNNVGIFTDDFFPFKGGIGRHIVEIINQIRDVNIIVFSPCKNEIKKHVRLFPFTKRLGKNILFSFLLNFQINKLIKKFNLNIVHLHCGPGGLILLIKPKAKLICTVHHTYYQQQKYIKGQKWKYVFYLFERITFKNADKIISVSEDTKNVLMKKYNINPQKITVIPNGVDTKKFRIIKNIKKIKNSLIFVGRLEERKGIDFLTKTIPLVKKKIPNIKLFIVGKGKLKTEIEEFIKKNNIIKNIEIINYIEDEELVKLYNKCELAIVPSVFEGFGISVIEAIACGLPVVGTNSDGVRSLINTFNNNYLVDYGNINQLSKILIIHFQKNKPFDKTNTKKIISNFSWKNIASKTTKLYD